MSERDNGGPAFPVAYSFHNERAGYDEVVRIDGMTLRDYFAAKATEEDIQQQIALIQKVEMVYSTNAGHKIGRWELPSNARQIARFMHADAMLKERAK